MLEGYAEDRSAELSQQTTRRPLVKSYLLETVPPNLEEPHLEEVFHRAGQALIHLDETLFKIHDEVHGKTMGLLEKLVPRHPVIYSTEKAEDIDPWVKRLVLSSPSLDHVWLSGRAFKELLDVIIRLTPGHRFGRVVFQHVNLFEGEERPQPDEEDSDTNVKGRACEELPETEEEAKAMEDDDQSEVVERRDTRFMVVDRLHVLAEKLPKMRGDYSPLHAISQLRFPAPRRGGHDFYYDGKVTNRSDSFTDHRLHLQFVLKLYRKATETTENTAWQSLEQSRVTTAGQQKVLVGAPVRLEFSEPLTQEVFDRFINATFRRKSNKFRLWGNPIKLGPRKVHVYGLDRHLWQPLFLEITDEHIVVIVPYGTCGNSIHRLVTNVQRYLDPGVKVWVGNREYAELLRHDPLIEGIYESRAP